VSDSELAGLRAMVTGGASGIGLATARLLATRGAAVVCLDVAAGAPEAPLEQVRADLSDDAAVRAAVRDAAERLGGIDIVVNNAGVGAVGTVEANPDSEWHRVFDVNVVGIVRVTRAACPTCAPRPPRWWSTPARSPPPSASPTAPCTAPPRAPCSR
jgi:NAD(P)-dependent dehydrogenase (short-subunit alcohol dehydrogenase family)